MRIVVLSNLYPPNGVGGYELRRRAFVEGLRQRGHEVHVVTSRVATRTGADDADLTRALHLFWSPPYVPEDVAGLLHHECMDRQAIASVLDRVRPDVIDVWGMEACSQSLVAALAAGPVPVHVTVDDVWLLDAFERDPLCMLAAVAAEAGVPLPAAVRPICCLGLERPPLGDASVAFVSPTLADRYRNAGLDGSRCLVRMAGIDVDAFRGLPVALEPPPFVILNVGQLTKMRGQADLIRAASLVAADRRCPYPIVLRIVGPGSPAYTQELRALAADCATSRLTIEIAGPVGSDAVAGCYADAHLFVHASRLPEGLPRVLMEALSAGVPVVATDTGGQRDVLADGAWGMLVAPAVPEALADAIRLSLCDRASWTERAARARSAAFERFDESACIDRHERDLQGLAARGWRFDAGPALAVDCPPDSESATFADAVGRAAERGPRLATCVAMRITRGGSGSS